MSMITLADFSRLFLTPFYSPPIRFAGTSAGTFYLSLADDRYSIRLYKLSERWLIGQYRAYKMSQPSRFNDNQNKHYRCYA